VFQDQLGKGSTGRVSEATLLVLREVVGQQASNEAAQVLGDALDPGSRPAPPGLSCQLKMRVLEGRTGDGFIPAAG